MCILHIHAQSFGRIFEVLPDDVASSELVVEEGVSHVLLKLFGEAVVDDVTVYFSFASRTGLRDCFVQIQAQCSLQSFTLLPCTEEYMKLAVGKSLSSLLKELFGPMTVEIVVVQPVFMGAGG